MYMKGLCKEYFGKHSTVEARNVEVWRARWAWIYKRGIIIRKSKKNRQHNGQKKKDKSTNNDLQNIHIKLKIE